MDSLPEDVRELAAQIVALAPQLGKLTVAEAQPLVAALKATAIRCSVADEAAAQEQEAAARMAALLSNAPFATALLQCIAYGARLSHSRLFTAASRLAIRLLEGPRASGAGPLAFLRALLRIQTLQCLARVLARYVLAAEAAGDVAGEAAAEAAGEAAMEAAAEAAGEAAMDAAAEAAGEAAMEAAAEAAGEAAMGAAAEAAGEAAMGAAARPANSIGLLALVIGDTNDLVSALCRLAKHIAEQPQPPAATAATPADKERRRLAVSQRVFVGELVSALAESGVMEHLARAVLVVATASLGVALAGEGAEQTRKLITGFMALYHNALGSVNKLAVALRDAPGCGGPAAAARLRSQLQGPCVLHLALTSGLAALCLTDGGPSHGLPQPLLQGLTVLAVGPDGKAVNARSLHGRQSVCTRHVFIMLDCLPCTTQPHLPPTLRPAAAASLLLRVGRWAVASGRAWAEQQQEPQPQPQGEEAAGPQKEEALGTRAEREPRTEPEPSYGQRANSSEPQPLRLLIPGEQLASVLHLALQQLDQLLAVTDLASDREAAWRVSVQRWRLLVEAFGDLGPYTGDEPATLLAKLWEPLKGGEVVGRGGALRSEPPAQVASALAAGLLPCLERLLRRAGAHSTDKELLVVLLMFARSDSSHVLLACLFAYGEPAQAAALVTTLAKLLRYEEKDPLQSSVGALSAVQRLYEAAPSYLASQPSPARSRLLLLLLRSVAEWLPTLCRMVQSAASDAAAKDVEKQQRSSPIDLRAYWLGEMKKHFAPVQIWIPILLACQPSPTASAASGSSGDAGGWRQFLVEEAGVLSVLGALLLAAQEWDPRQRTAAGVMSYAAFWYKVVHACAHVAVGAPEDVRQAVREGAAGGRRSGKPGGRAGAASGWRPQILAKLSDKMRAAGFGLAVPLTLRLSHLLSVWAEGDDASQELAELGVILRDEPERRWGPLPPLASVRALLPSCAHQRCTRLDGDSEAGRELRRYPGCGQGAYCSAACAQEHGAGAAAGASGAGGSGAA